MIELAGSYEFAAPQALVWEMLLNPDVLARIMPGCKKLECIGDNNFEGVMNLKVGPVQGAFQGTLFLSELQPPHSYHILINGRGPAGVVRGEGDLHLQSNETGTELQYEGQAQVSGRIAAVGQRLMDSSAKAIVNQSLQNLEVQIQSQLHPEPIAQETAVTPSLPTTPPPAPDQTDFIFGVTKDVITDLIPDARQRWLFGGLVLLVVSIGLGNWFANLVARRVAKILQEE